MILRNSIIHFIFFCILIPSVAISGTIKGHVYGRATGTPLVDATIHLKNTSFYTASGLDGSFIIKNIPQGVYTIAINYISFQPFMQSIKIEGSGEVVIEARLESNNESQLQEVIVEDRRNGANEIRARSLEQSASQVMNIISGQAIKISPDLTVANLVQRVSGVSVEMDNSGHGEYAILRGMDKRYNYTLVNGVKIPSPDKESRYVPLDIFPSELLERLEVYKTLTPDMEGDAVGGVVNMVMKDAPDSLSLSVNVATGYNDIFLDRNFISFRHNEINKKSPYETHSSRYNAVSGDFSNGPVHYQEGMPVPDLIAGFVE